MSAIRDGRFKLKAVKGPTQQTASAADARDALFNAIKNRQFSLKAVSPADEQTAGKYIPPSICSLQLTAHTKAWCLPACSVPAVHYQCSCLG